MSEIRKDIITGNQVIIASERGKRPHDFKLPTEEERATSCPFCSGNEQLTPPEVAALRPTQSGPDTPGWQIRVVPNKFAALHPEEEFWEREEGLYSYCNGKGSAEVVVESPDHYSNLGEKGVEDITALLEMIEQRYRTLLLDRAIKYVQVFKNFGPTAGASLAHPHWQIMATPMIPDLPRQELAGAAAYYRKYGSCVYCSILAAEKENGERVITANQSFVAFCPYAARYPFESWIVPVSHASTFGRLTRTELRELACLLRKMIAIFELEFRSPYNLIIHTRALDDRHRDSYHWHIEILPRLTIMAGFELGTGIMINPTAPEVAAGILREKYPDY